MALLKGVVVKDKKTENIHHFADEFAFEDLKGESGVESAHHTKHHLTKEGQFALIMKQISDINGRIERLEKVLEEQS